MSTTKFLGNIAFSTFSENQAAQYTFKNTIDVKETTITTVKVEVKDKTGEIASWGKKNDYPQKIVEAIKMSGAGSSGLRLLRKVHYGNGLILMTNKPDENGKKSPKLIDIQEYKEIYEFFIANQFTRFFKETIADLEWFSIAFPEYILSDNFTKINKVKRHQTAWCRFELMNSENGLIENVYISQKFGKETVSSDSEYVAKIPLVDSYWSVDQVKEYCKINNIKKFVRPVFYPLIDEAYYPEAEWHSVVKNGWTTVGNSVPAFKQAIFNNQVSIKFHVEIDERYFEKVYDTDWKEYTVDERKSIRSALIDTINEHLSKNENAGKSLASMKLQDDNGNQISTITIQAIDDKFQDGTYLPEAEAANSEILFAQGVDPSLIGAGSGSDKRVAMNILQSLKKTDRETTLEIFEFIKQYNGWPAEITANFENNELTTLDANPTGQQTATA
jgi:hypothetical protein